MLEKMEISRTDRVKNEKTQREKEYPTYSMTKEAELDWSRLAYALTFFYTSLKEK